jgi:hypothetical protein
MTLHLSLSGESEEFLHTMTSAHVTPEDVIGRALWLLKTAHDTYRVGFLAEGWREVPGNERVVDHVILAIDPARLQRDITVPPPVMFKPKKD